MQEQEPLVVNDEDDVAHHGYWHVSCGIYIIFPHTGYPPESCHPLRKQATENMESTSSPNVELPMHAHSNCQRESQTRVTCALSRRAPKQRDAPRGHSREWIISCRERRREEEEKAEEEQEEEGERRRRRRREEEEEMWHLYHVARSMCHLACII